MPLQNLLAVGAMSIMYKVQRLGPQNVLHKYEPFLTDPAVCVALYLLASALCLTASCVVYMYGYSKFASFVEREGDRHSIRLRAEGPFTTLWSYFPHCSAMCVLIALAVVNAPLLYDFTLIYKVCYTSTLLFYSTVVVDQTDQIFFLCFQGSLDGAVLLHVVSTILHLFFWIVMWLFLTAKQSWRFKLRVTVGRAVVRGARSIKLANDVDLQNRAAAAAAAAAGGDAGDAESATAMLIVSHGKSYTVSDAHPKKLIMSTLARAAIERDKAMEEAEEAAGSGEECLGNSSTAARRARNTGGGTQQSPARQVTFEGDSNRPATMGSPR